MPRFGVRYQAFFRASAICEFGVFLPFLDPDKVIVSNFDHYDRIREEPLHYILIALVFFEEIRVCSLQSWLSIRKGMGYVKLISNVWCQ